MIALTIEVTPLAEDVMTNEIVIATQLPPATYDAVIAGLEDALNRYATMTLLSSLRRVYTLAHMWLV